jgi:hypothetical protein
MLNVPTHTHKKSHFKQWNTIYTFHLEQWLPLTIFTLGKYVFKCFLKKSTFLADFTREQQDLPYFTTRFDPKKGLHYYAMEMF